MAASDKRGGDAPAAMRIKLKYADEQAFIEKFGTNVTRGGIFLGSRSPKPVGTVVRFELQLADGAKIFKGEGVVTWIREFDAEHPNRPHGMGLKFNKIDADSRRLVEKIVAYKKARGLRDDAAVPTPLAIAPESGPVVAEGTGRTKAAPPPPEPERDEVAAPPEPTAPPAAIDVAPATVADVDVEALLAMDGPALEATLARARDIARAIAASGALAELEELLREAPQPAAGASAAEASAGLAAMFGGAVPVLRVVPAAAAARPLPQAPEAADTSPAAPPDLGLAELTRDLAPELLTPPPTEPDTEDTAPLDIGRLAAESGLGAQLPAALGAEELEPNALEEMTRLEPLPREDIEPLPPPPPARASSSIPLSDEDLEVGLYIEPDTDTSLEEQAAAAAPPAPPPPPEAPATDLPPDLAAELDAALDLKFDELVEPAAPQPTDPAAAGDAATEDGGGKKKGFFKKLFGK